VNRFARELDRTLAQLTVPQGYTLSIGGSLAVTAHTYGSPSGTRATEFVAGALLAFVLLVAVAARPSAEPGLTAALAGLARYNITPLAVIALVALVVHLVPSPAVGFFLAGAFAAGGYALAVSLFEVYTRR